MPRLRVPLQPYNPSQFGSPERGISGKFFGSYPKRDSPNPNQWWWGPLIWQKDTQFKAHASQQDPKQPDFPCFAVVKMEKPTRDFGTFVAMKKRASAAMEKREETVKKALRKHVPLTTAFQDYIQVATGLRGDWMVTETRPVVKASSMSKLKQIPGLLNPTNPPAFPQDSALEVVLSQKIPECNMRLAKAFPTEKIDWRKAEMLPEDYLGF